MHILVINDDGPPSNQSSPYVHSLTKTLQEYGHTVSTILPHVQRSWIGKAHFVGQVTKPTYFRPGTLHQDDGTVHERPLAKDDDEEEWVLVNGTPATCAQLGVFHFFQHRGPVDLVISGPNYGRNSTSLFSLSSGTIGGAMEAAVCGKRAIALSYAFYSRDHDPKLIAGASRLSVRLIEHLYQNWGQGVDLYSINVPLVDGVEQHKIMYTDALQTTWSSGSSFLEVDAREEDEDPNKREEEIRQGKASSADSHSSRPTTHKHRHFKWSPKFADVQKSIEESPPGNDGWAIGQGYTSVTPLRANYMHVLPQGPGELKLSPSVPVPHSKPPPVYTLVNYEDNYVQPLILEALRSRSTLESYIFINSLSDLPDSSSPCLQITSYESIDFEHLLAHPSTSLANAYVIRKALIRKHYLSNTIFSWLTKSPDSPLRSHVKPSVDFELDYAEFLAEALMEAYELHESFARNQDKEPRDREWWILKPSMSDRGQGIRLFSTEDELRTIFEEWESEQPDSDTEPEEAEIAPFDPTAPILNGSTLSAQAANPNSIITSQLRHFIAQPYIHPPLLFPAHQHRKFHIRSYVLAVGALKVYLYKEMLALFAPESYTAPGSLNNDNDYGADTPASGPDLRAHLTNTCLQNGTREGSVLRFWNLPSSLPSSSSQEPTTSPAEWKSRVYDSISTSTSELFLAAARTQSIHFQTLPNAFEIFGVDWLVDAEGRVWLLEVNAFPDLAQTGEDLRNLVGGLWKGVVETAVREFFGGEEAREEERDGMRMVLDVDLGRKAYS